MTRVKAPGSSRIDQNILLVAQALDVSAALAAAQIESILLKGCAYALEIYEIGERSFKDIDILVRRSDVGRADAVLRAKGFKPWVYRYADETDPRFNIERHYDKGNVRIDLHFSLVQGFRGVELDEEAVFASARPVQTVKLLGHEDALWFIVEHARRDRAGGDRAIHDFKRYVERHGAAIDWNAFHEKVETRQVRNAAGFFLERLETIYPDLRIARPRSRPSLLVRALVGLQSSPKPASDPVDSETSDDAPGRSLYTRSPGFSGTAILGALCEDRFVIKLRRLKYVLFPPASRMQLLYGLAPESRVPRILYATRLVRGVAAEVRRLVTRKRR